MLQGPATVAPLAPEAATTASASPARQATHTRTESVVRAVPRPFMSPPGRREFRRPGQGRAGLPCDTSAARPPSQPAGGAGGSALGQAPDLSTPIKLPSSSVQNL